MNQESFQCMGLIVMQWDKGGVYGESNRAKKGSGVWGGSQESLIYRSQENLRYVEVKVI